MDLNRHAADHLALRDVAIDQGRGRDEGFWSDRAARQHDRAGPHEAAPPDRDRGRARGKACDQRMILVTNVEVGKQHRARSQRDMIFEHHRRGEVHQHVVADETVRADPERPEPAAIDVDQRETMQDRIGADRRTAQTKKHCSQRRKGNQPEDRQQNRSPQIPYGAARPNFLKRLHRRAPCLDSDTTRP